ncbi:DNA helicase [Tanacetum coccineum]
MEEKSYNKVELAKEVTIWLPKLNAHQRRIFELIIDVAAANRQELIFVYEGKIVLADASSDIASLLLPAGRTTHSRFKIPLKVTDESLYKMLPVKKGTSKAEIIATSIAESELWPHFKVYTLKENMCLPQPGINEDKNKLAISFASWLLDIKDGKIWKAKRR